MTKDNITGENGRVYTFGYGGKKVNPIMKLFMNYVGALGHGTQESYSRPKIVKAI